jgi:hypothetical protein
MVILPAKPLIPRVQAAGTFYVRHTQYAKFSERCGTARNSQRPQR